MREWEHVKTIRIYCMDGALGGIEGESQLCSNGFRRSSTHTMGIMRVLGQHQRGSR